MYVYTHLYGYTHCIEGGPDITMADLGGLLPPFLKSQKVQKNECNDIRTQ